MDLRPPRDPRLHLEPPPLARRVLLDLIRERGAGTDEAHVAAHDVPELRELVEGQPSQHATGPRDPRVAFVHRIARAVTLGPDRHRAQLDELELLAVEADTSLAVENGAAVVEL